MVWEELLSGKILLSPFYLQRNISLSQTNPSYHLVEISRKHLIILLFLSGKISPIHEDQSKRELHYIFHLQKFYFCKTSWFCSRMVTLNLFSSRLAAQKNPAAPASMMVIFFYYSLLCFWLKARWECYLINGPKSASIDGKNTLF